jgi:DNA repair exonuclease SbcCD ATPase subunit
LKEQLDQIEFPDVSIDEVQKEYDELGSQAGEIQKTIDSANGTNREYDRLKANIDSLQEQIVKSAEHWSEVVKNSDKNIKETCEACKQPLDEESKKAAKAFKVAEKNKYKEKHTEMVEKRNKLQEELANLNQVDLQEEYQKIHDLDDKRLPLSETLRKHKQHEQLLTQVEQAKTDEEEKLKSLNESIFILDSIKAFKAKEAELQGEKVQKLFTTLFVRLFDVQKNGDIKPTFEIEMDGRPYSKLSQSESIRAGLELREVLSQQSEIVAPVFVDNAESITSFKEPTGQLIISRVVAGEELKIEVKSND